jgi:hypothetical protein
LIKRSKQPDIKRSLDQVIRTYLHPFGKVQGSGRVRLSGIAVHLSKDFNEGSVRIYRGNDFAGLLMRLVGEDGTFYAFIIEIF